MYDLYDDFVDSYQEHLDHEFGARYDDNRERYYEEMKPDYCDCYEDEDPMTPEDIAWAEGYAAVCEVVSFIRSYGDIPGTDDYIPF
jgi:hypothetical protein